VVQYTCTVDGGLLTWGIPDNTNSVPFGSFDELNAQKNVTYLTQLFTAVLIDKSNNQLTSTLSFITTTELSNTLIMCTGSTTEMCNVKISGKSEWMVVYFMHSNVTY